MSGKRSKNKGKRSERELSAILTEIFGKTFIRVPNSGSFIGGKNAKRKNSLDKSQEKLMKGDIIPPEGLEHLVFECKNHKDIKLDSILSGNNAKINSWINQCLEITEESDLWFVCFKIPNRGWFVITNEKHVDFSIFSNNYMVYYYRNEKYILTELISFFKIHKQKYGNFNKTSSL